jgi:hypothetical protein
MTDATLFKLSSKSLVETTFLQIYATLEESLYDQCKQYVIKKNASIIRFASALTDQGYNLENEYWSELVNLSKIRNCLLHGNGRLDNDKYGIDTRTIITRLNSAAKKTLIEIMDLQETSKLQLNLSVLDYFATTIKLFISTQKK